MTGESRATGFAVPVILALWVAGVLYAFSTIELGGDAAASPSSGSPTPTPTPVALPTEVLVGSALDPESGQVGEPQSRFEPGSSVAFSAWLGRTLDSPVSSSLLQLTVDGFAPVVVLPRIITAPGQLYVAGEISTVTAEQHLTGGTYALELVTADSARIGYATFQVATETPQSVELFAEGERPVTLDAGPHTGFRIEPSGEIVGETPATLGAESTATAIHRATFDGQSYVFITAGIWANHYIPESEGVRLGEPAAPEPAASPTGSP